MYIEPIKLGSREDYWWITVTPTVRNADKNKQINPFSPDGKTSNPLRDLVTLSDQNTQSVRETSEFSPVLNYLFLMFPHEKIKQFAYDVVGVRPDDSNDRKMSKIARWVQSNIKYLTDEENYDVPEFWAPPIFTLAKASGDCEDGAFLIASLALNSGVPASRIRMYGGLVDAGAGAPSGGHGWVGYQRESDNEWVAIDFSYYPDPNILSLPPMSEDLKYQDDYFYMTVNEITYTPGTNRVRNPDGYDSMARVRYSILVGQLVDAFI
jgi:predicted transglutaminase-like cysteine proteinase